MAEWTIDPDHSVAAFAVRHLTVAHVHGQFNAISGRVYFDPRDQTRLTVEAEIDAAGIYTGISKRDEHLRSPDFFDSARFPTIHFHSTGFAVGEGPGGKLTGQLMVRGIARPVILEVAVAGPVISPKEIGGETTIGISGRTTVNREDFGMTWNLFLPNDRVVVGKIIEITLEIEADLKE